MFFFWKVHKNRYGSLKNFKPKANPTYFLPDDYTYGVQMNLNHTKYSSIAWESVFHFV